MAFVLGHRVRFADCDPAGIAYYPRIFGWFHAAMEAFFDEALERPYAKVIATGIGMPTVHCEADFRRPCALGDDLDVTLTVERLGDTSVTFGFVVAHRGDPSDVRVRGEKVVVFTDLVRMAPRSLPVDLRAALARHLVDVAEMP